MSFISRLKQAWSFLTKATDVGVFGGLFGSSRGESENVNGWQYKASKLLGEEIGAMALKFYRVQRDGTWDEVTGAYELQTLLDTPNPDMTRAELFEATSMHLDFYGNAYWYLDGVRDEKGKPKAIYLLDASKIKVKKTDVFPSKIEGYVYRFNGREIPLQLFQVLHFRETNPSDALIGLGPIEANSDAIELDQDARTWNKAFFRNSARPDLLLKTKFKTREQMEPMRAQFEDKYRGARNAHKVAVLPDGVEAEKLGWNQKEMDFVEQLRWTRDDILSGLRTPHVVLGLGAGENLNRATAEATNYIYALRTVEPRMKRIVLFLNVRLLPRYGVDLVCDFDSPVPQNEELDIKKRQAALGNQPYETVNEVRDSMGLPPVDGGDRIMAPFNFTPAGSASKPPVPPAKAIPPRIKAFHAKQEHVEKDAEALAGKITDRLKVAMEQEKRKATSGEAQWNDFVARVTPYENKAKEALADYAKGMGERVLASLEQQTKAVEAGSLLNSDEEIALIIDALGPVMRDLMESEGQTRAEIIGGAFDAASDRVQKALSDAMSLMAGSYNQTTIDALKQALQAGEEEGEGIDQLKKRIKDIAEFAASYRSEMVAKTESFRIANMAAREAYIQLGIEEMVWYTAADERVCEFCGPLHGKVVKTKEVFFEKGAVITGSKGGVMELDYSDVTGGALHPNCRCDIVPNINFQD